VHVVRGDAFDLAKTLGSGELFAGIVSGLPLLNHPVDRRRALIQGALERLKPGAPYVQFSYGTRPPIESPSGAKVVRAAVIWLNLPPARVWVYRRV
jgi:phosphatidylethanolamine/phosphatidyl-N-methylethanolamine N-methyltransferase